MKQFESGAKSTVQKPRYDLIPLPALKILADRFEFGAKSHGERNYRKGANDVEFIRDRINHMVEHVHKYAEFKREEDLGAILCNAAILADCQALVSEVPPEVL